MTTHNLVYLLIIVLILGALVPYWRPGSVPAYTGPSLIGIVLVLIVLRMFGII